MTRPPEWRPIPGARRYDVSDAGLVRDAKTRELKMLSRSARISSGSQYFSVSLVCDDGHRRNIYVHRAVASAFLFLGELPAGAYVCHRDDDRSNNAVGNLYVGTPSQNAADARRNRCRTPGRGAAIVASMDAVRATIGRAAKPRPRRRSAPVLSCR